MACAFDVEDVRPKPSCDQRMTAVPRASRAKLRMTWKATCGSSAQAWTQMSPPLRSGSQRVAGQRAGSAQRGRALAGEPEPVVEQRRPEADGDGQLRRPQARSPRRCRSAAPAARSPPRRSAGPCVSCAAAAAQVPSMVLTSSTSVDVTSNAANASRSCAGRGDAGLVRSVERHDLRSPASAIGRRCRLGRLGDAEPAPPAATAPGGTQRAAEESAAARIARELSASLMRSRPCSRPWTAAPARPSPRRRSRACRRVVSSV